MDVKLLEAIRRYVDKAIEHEFATREEGSDGYFVSAVQERKAKEMAWEKVMSIAIKK